MTLAETTPGPLVLVLTFTGFMAAYRAPGDLSPLMGGITAMMKEPRDIESALVTFLVLTTWLGISSVVLALFIVPAGMLPVTVNRMSHPLVRSCFVPFRPRPSSASTRCTSRSRCSPTSG